MDSPQFREFYSKLNPEQKLAVDTIEGPVMVIAGPGTGKTQILTLRIANILIKTQTNPENILAMTFTESAAKEMQERLVDVIGTSGYRVQISTFHGFCNEVIKSYPEDFPHLLNADSITEVDQVQLIEELLITLPLTLLKPLGDQLYYLRQVLSEINNLKKEGIPPEQLKDAIKKQREEFNSLEDLYHDKGKYKGEMKGKYQDLLRDINKNEEFCTLFFEYQKNLREKKLYDFNDMLLEVKVALEKNKDLRLRLQEKYHYILVDEHQDTNASQNKIIQLLGDFFELPNIFVVGDEKQAIFRFQGASLENFLYFRVLYPEAKLISLIQNYRSHQKILDAADSLISKNYFSNVLLPDKVSLKAANKITEEPLKLLEFNDYFAEYEYIAKDIVQKIEKGTHPSEITVIGRNNRDLVEMANTLERFGVNFSVHADINIFQDSYIQKLFFIFRAVENVGSEIDLLKAMHIDIFKISPLDIYKIVDFSRKNEISVFDFLLAVNQEKARELNLESFYQIEDFYKKLQKWQQQNHNNGFERLFIDVLTDSGLKQEILSSPKRYEVLDKIISLFEEIKALVYKNPDFSLKDFLNYLDLCIKHGVALKTRVQTVYRDAVNLMTTHRSKGLEFEYVYVLNCFDGHWGNSRRKSKGFNIPWSILGIKLNAESDENEDERRLFFVALTRAKKDVVLAFSNRSIDGKDQVLSQFATEIEPSLVEKVDISQFEQQFLANKQVILDPKDSIKPDPKQLEFFRKLFSERGLSATAINNYLKCPWTYFYRNLLLFPGVRSNSEIFGTAIHSALDKYLKSKGQKITSDNLLRWFDEIISKTQLSQVDRQQMREKGKKALENYLENKLPEWLGKVQSETVIRGVRLADGIILNGRIDMIEPGEKENQIIVHDFKTGKPKSRNAISGLTASTNVNYLRQLTFYKLLIEKYKNNSMKVVGGVIDFVEPDDKGKIKSEYFDISEEEVKALENQILFIAGEIKNLEFWDRTCDEKDCEYCLLRKATF